MKKFEEMTDQELIDFGHENMLGVEVCMALGCEEWCKEQDCPMFQCLNRFENYIKDHPTEKGGVEE